MSGTGMIRRGIGGERTTARSWGQRAKSALFGTLLGLIIPSLAFGQATLLPDAKQQYLDDAGNPVANGTVTYYVPSTSTKKDIWLDAAQSTLSTNPVLLDAAGRPQPTGQTYGLGSYRQKVVDENNITVWDAVTISTGGSGGSSTAFSEGVMVGTILPWANTTLPGKYLYTAGQAIVRATYPDLLTAVTYRTTILCQSGIATVTVSTTISDSMPIGAPIEAPCFAPGTVVNSKVSGQLTMSTNATVTTSVAAVLFPWGNGNGSTTFNVPDYRGRTLIGRNNMGGSASSVMTSTYYKTPAGVATDPNAVNALAGRQSDSLVAGNLPVHTHTSSTLTDPGHVHTNLNVGISGIATTGTTSGSATSYSTAASTSSAVTGITISASTGNNASGLSTPFSFVQPSATSDYIIKALPDDSPTGPGVTSIQGMTGAIGCGTGLTCTAQTISVNFSALGSALTKVDDTNVTLTLGGSPSTALLNAASLTLGWAGQLAVTRGGTGLAAGTSGGIPYFNSTTTMASSGLLGANQIILGGGAGTSPATLGSLGTTSTVLHGNAGGAPSFGAVVSADLNITPTACTNQYITAISAAALGTCTAVVLAGTTFANQGTTTTVLHGNAAGNPSWSAIALGTDVSGTLGLANGGAGGSLTANNGGVVYSDATRLQLLAGTVTAGQCLLSGSSTAPTWGSCAGGATVTAFNGQTGPIFSYFPPQGRLTLQTLTPVMTTTQSAKTAIFYTPYHGNMVPIYDGTNMVPTAVAEVTVATTDTTQNPAAIGASKVNDWFIWSKSGTIVISHGPDWTNDTTRSAGTALVMANGILLNNATIGNGTTTGPAASRGTYVGTTRSNGSSQLDFIFGASNTAAFFGVWNAYNRVSAPSGLVSESAGSHNYLSATIRQANASAIWQITFVTGAVEDTVAANLVTQINTAAVSQAVGYAGVALNSTTTFTHGRNFVQAATAAVTQMSTTHSASMTPILGVNVISANEASDGTNTNGFNASSLNVLSGSVRN